MRREGYSRSALFIGILNLVSPILIWTCLLGAFALVLCVLDLMIGVAALQVCAAVLVGLFILLAPLPCIGGVVWGIVIMRRSYHSSRLLCMIFSALGLVENGLLIYLVLYIVSRF